MSISQPTVSVIIPARHAAETVPLALESVASQTYPHIAEVIVAAADPESARVATEAGATVVDNPEGTTPAALNRAIEASSGEVIVRCDAHSVLPPDYVERAVETMTRTGADNVGGMQVPVGETFWEQAIAAGMASSLGAGDARYRIGGEEGPAETVYLGVFKREALERLGGFDPTMLRNQDYELNHRIIESGGVVWFDPRLQVEYRPRSSLGALARQYYQYGRAKRHMLRKHPESLRWRQLAAPAVVLVLGAAVLVSLVWPPVLLVVLGYAVAVVVASLAAAGSLARGLGAAAALATIHLSWGAGFVRGPG